MPFWSWIIIWAVLALALLGMLAYFGYRLFRKLMAALEALGELSEKAALLDDAAESLRDAPFEPAVFADAGALSRQRRLAKAASLRRRQARREKRLERGRLLVKADPQQFSYLVKRT